MPISVRCTGCGRNLSIPDELAGTMVACPGCGSQVMAEAPLMPPPMPGSEPAPAPTPVTPAPAAPAQHTAAAPSAQQPSAAAPPVRHAAPAAAPQSAPPPGGAPQPPPRRVPPPRSHHHDADGFDGFPSETVERAMKMSRPNTGAWVIAGFIIVILLGFGGFLIIRELTTVNPPLYQVEQRLDPHKDALKLLGKRRGGAGYSFLLPDDFLRAEPPSTDRLPSGTRSYGWMADPESEEKGALFRFWVIPRKMDIFAALGDMDSVGSRLDYHADIVNKSTHRRIGKNMLAVRGLLDASTGRTTRKGVIYIIADGNRTLMVIGMGEGPEFKRAQFMLDHAARTIRRGSVSSK